MILKVCLLPCPTLLKMQLFFFQFLLLHSCSYLPAPKGYLLIIYQVTIPWCSWTKTSITLEFTVVSDTLFSQKVLSWDTWQQHKASYHVMCRMGILTIFWKGACLGFIISIVSNWPWFFIVLPLLFIFH